MFHASNKIKLGIVGLGHAGNLHLRAIDSLQSIFELSLSYDLSQSKTAQKLPKNKIVTSVEDILNSNIDCVILSCPSASKFQLSKLIFESGKSIFSEKPQVLTLKEFDYLNLLAKNKDLIFQGAFHSTFNPLQRQLLKEITIFPGKTVHKKFGELINIELNRFDPYVQSGQVIDYAPEKTSGLDSWPNILSELALYVNSYKVKDVKYLDTSFAPNYPEVKTKITGIFPEGKFIANTDWTNGQNIKKTTLFFEKATVILDYTGYQLTVTKNDQIVSKQNFDQLGSRLEIEYKRMYKDLFNVLTKTRQDNREIIKNITQMLENYCL